VLKIGTVKENGEDMMPLQEVEITFAMIKEETKNIDYKQLIGWLGRNVSSPFLVNKKMDRKNFLC